VFKNKPILIVLSLFVGGHGNVMAMGDPTKPPMSVQLKQTVQEKRDGDNKRPLQLNTIKISGLLRLAVINGQQYRVGQMVGESRIKSISLNKVVLGSGKTLSLFDEAQVHVANKGY